MQDTAVVEKLFLTLHVTSFLGSARPMTGEGATLFGHRGCGGRGLSMPGALSLYLFSHSSSAWKLSQLVAFFACLHSLPLSFIFYIRGQVVLVRPKAWP